ncbi:hypothetical protein L6452_02974 [Arctium lappa]|uniref:Uncharacterized protein n=1 Tax=Arctium lappa TaxID=4217 RepID=A0ACB9FLX3_ARCLA|nr:hypothetical protein L6452_02974 [Arctium lappa]
MDRAPRNPQVIGRLGKPQNRGQWISGNLHFPPLYLTLGEKSVPHTDKPLLQHLTHPTLDTPPLNTALHLLASIAQTLNPHPSATADLLNPNPHTPTTISKTPNRLSPFANTYLPSPSTDLRASPVIDMDHRPITPTATPLISHQESNQGIDFSTMASLENQ